MRRRRQLSWDQIERKAGRAAARRPGRGRRWLIALLLVVLAGTIATVAAGFSGRGPYAQLAARRTTTSAAPTTTLPGGTTTTEFLLDGRMYRPGDCVIWDEDEPDARYHATDVVACAEEHFLEVAGTVVAEGPSDKVPTDAEWEPIIEQRCREIVERHFGGPIDPQGRYDLTALHPSDDGWRSGDRTMWCGLQANWAEPGDRERYEQTGVARNTPFRGEARAATQFWTYDAGDCLAPASPLTVSCGAEHTREVVGTIVLADDTVLPADDAGWQAVVGEGCRNRARTYLGGNPRDPWSLGWHVPASESWATGARTATCFVGRWDGNGTWSTVTGSARAEAA